MNITPSQCKRFYKSTKHQKNSVLIHFHGGLGNQIFLYAFYLYLQSIGVKVKFNFREFKYDAYHYGIELHKIFDIDCSSTIKKIEKFRKLNNKKQSKFSSRSFVLWRLLMRYKPISENNTKVHSPSTIAPILENFKKIFIIGNFISIDYPETIKNTLFSKLLKIENMGRSNDELLNTIKCRNSISIHVRRGDYINLGWDLLTANVDYYNRAIKIMCSQIYNPIFIVFSDDPVWVKNNLLIPHDHIFVDWNNGEESYKDLLLMTQCSHNIIANSTFSWWGAYLNQNPNKMVIVPKEWAESKTDREITPQNWIKIEV